MIKGLDYWWRLLFFSYIIGIKPEVNLNKKIIYNETCRPKSM